MINFATSRLAAWAKRAKAVLIDGSLPLPVDDGFADHLLPGFLGDDDRWAAGAAITRSLVAAGAPANLITSSPQFGESVIYYHRR